MKKKGMTGGKKREKPRLWSLDKADEECSLWVRERDGWTCKRCDKFYPEISPGKRQPGLTNSHFWGRQHKGTRFDPDNCDAVCWMPCHKYYWEKEKQGDYRDFKIKQLGQEKYDALEKRARNPYPQDRAIMECMELTQKAPKGANCTVD